MLILLNFTIRILAPPEIAFTWRHWGDWEGEYKGNQATGERIEMFGSCVVKVSENLKIQSIDVYFDPNPMLVTLTNFAKSGGKCPLSI